MCVVAVLALLAAATAASQAAAGAPAGTFSGCPRDTRPLSGGIATFTRPLSRAVLQFMHGPFLHITKTPASQLVGARVTGMVLVRHWLPSGWIKDECGLTVWRNSVVVDVYYPRLDKPHNPVGHCNSCDQLVFLAARASGGWTIWGDY